MIRLAANTGCALHLIEPLGFSMDDRLLRRAGLDYHEYAAVRRHALVAASGCAAQRPDPQRCFAFTTRGTQRLFADVPWQRGDWLVFGSETRRPAGRAARATSRRRNACACRCAPASAA